MSTHRNLAKSAGALGALTATSRVLGFVRDIVIAAAFGTGVEAEAFVVSFKIPNLLRDLAGEGAANAAFVPVLTECRQKRQEEFWGLVWALILAMAGILAGLVILGIIFTPRIVALIAPGFIGSSDPGKFILAVRLTRVIFPYIFLIGLSALAMGILNSLKEFTSSALGPILLNICMILAGFFFEPVYGPMALVMGVLAGGVLQLVCQIPALFKMGFRFVKPSWRHPSVKQIGKLLIPRALGSALYQINVFVDTILASFENIVGPGGQSALYYSNRLFQLPLAIFGISLAQTLLPTFSSQIVDGDLEGFKKTFSLSVRTLTLVILPASVGLIVLSEPIIRIIFEHGRFDATSTTITSSALFFYAFGLLSCCFIKVLANAFYAMKDTKTPLKTMAFSVALNVVLCLVLMGPFKIGGLTLASSLSATVNMGLLYYFLRKKVGPPDEKEILKTFLKTFLAAALMGFFAGAYLFWVLKPHAASGKLTQGLLLAFGIFSSIVFYLALTLILKVKEVRKVLPWPRVAR